MSENIVLPNEDLLDNTPFSDIYSYFLSGITDDMYISITEEETYADLESLLKKAIVSFRGCKKPIRRYDLNKKVFLCNLNYDETYILSLLMNIFWIIRQMNTVRLTEMQYTGSDAKVLNTKSQMSTLKELKEEMSKLLEKQLHDYHYHKEDEDGRIIAEDINFYGKGPSNNGLLRRFR